MTGGGMMSFVKADDENNPESVVEFSEVVETKSFWGQTVYKERTVKGPFLLVKELLGLTEGEDDGR